MSSLFYNIFIRLYSSSAGLASPFNKKAALWIKGRKNIFRRLKEAFADKKENVTWMHCASLGEFEQGRPVIERLKELYPTKKILLTFFSPSGYEVQKNYAKVDYVFYLPVDTKNNAKKFLDLTNPSLIIFVKYEFWFHYLSEARQRKIPLLLISGIFRRDQPFFQWYGGLYKKMLRSFTHFFVQNQASLALLNSINITNVSVSGDTRFDRVLAIATQFENISLVEKFCSDHIVIVAGSTWTEDDEELNHFVNTHRDIRFIIAPHDISEERLKECEKLYRYSVRYSRYLKSSTTNQPSTINYQPLTNKNTLIIDNIGMLSRLYKYASVCYVGGAFGEEGVHNVLEAAVYNKPVVFGPVFDKYAEAVELIDAGGAFTINNALELEKTFDDLLKNKERYNTAAKAAGDYVRSKAGATEKVIQYIQEKRLLTN